jgi:hypothetical protein
MSERIERERGGSGRRWGDASARVWCGPCCWRLLAGGCERGIQGERKLDRAER